MSVYTEHTVDRGQVFTLLLELPLCSDSVYSIIFFSNCILRRPTGFYFGANETDVCDDITVMYTMWKMFRLTYSIVSNG